MLTSESPRPQAAAPGDDHRAARDADIRRLLALARSMVGFDVAWLSRFEASSQVFTHVSRVAGAAGPEEGSAGDLDGSYCLRVLDGRLPHVVPDVAAEPEARVLPVTADLGIAAYAGVPVTGAGGRLHGMLCCTHGTASPAVGERERRTLDVMARAIGALLDGEQDAVDAERVARVGDAIAGSGRSHVLQPIVDVRTGRAVGMEALARFTTAPHRPDLWFELAEEAGLLLPLELAAAATALSGLGEHPGYLSVNLSPSTVLEGGLDPLLAGIDPARVVVEITEHAPVSDYERLSAALAPHRAAGLRVAIDDAGAGYASFRHILALRPDYIKVDLSLVRDIHLDPVRQALTASLLTFARTAGAQLIAEGVETQNELDTLARLGVVLMQGYLLGRPSATPRRDGFPRPSRHVLADADTDLTLVLANAVRHSRDLEQLARPLLDAVLRLTGLETSCLNVLSTADELEHRFVRNAGAVELPEGVAVSWSQSLCAVMQRKRLVWTNDAARDLAEHPVTAAFGLTTYVSSPLTALDGTLIGTLCAGSTEPVHISDATVAQLQLIGHVLGRELASLRD